MISIFPNESIGLPFIKNAQQIETDEDIDMFGLLNPSVVMGMVRSTPTNVLHKNPFIRNTRQVERPFFDPALNKWKVNLTNEEVQDVVRQLRYVDDVTGDPIAHADLGNFRDPFFMKFKLELKQGKGQLDETTVHGNFFLKCLEVHPWFMYYGDRDIKDFNPKYYMKKGINTDVSNELEAGKSDINLIQNLFDYKGDMEVLRSICRLMDLETRHAGQELGNEDLVALIANRCIQDKYDPRARSKFSALMKKGKDAILVYDHLKTATRQGVVVKQGESWLFMNTLLQGVSGNNEGLYRFFTNSKNAHMWEDLLRAIGKSEESGN